MTRPAQLALLTIVTHYGSAKLQAADRVSRVAEGNGMSKSSMPRSHETTEDVGGAAF